MPKNLWILTPGGQVSENREVSVLLIQPNHRLQIFDVDLIKFLRPRSPNARGDRCLNGWYFRMTPLVSEQFGKAVEVSYNIQKAPSPIGLESLAQIEAVMF
ncbi:hypothetical protein D3C72_805000 [compost metagenome]